MSLKNFLILNAVLFVPFGLCMLFMPNTLFPLFGVDLDADGTLMARVMGSALFSIGLMCYLVRNENEGALGMKAIVIGNVLFHALDTITTFMASYNGTMNSLGWMFCGLHFMLTLGFLFYWNKISKLKPPIQPGT